MRENLEGSLRHLELAKALHMKLKKKKTKWQKIKLELYKIKIFYAANDTIKKAKRQPTGWQKIFANHISKNLYLYKEFLIFNNKNRSNWIKNGWLIWIDISPKSGLISTWKDAQHHSSLGKCKLKL